MTDGNGRGVSPAGAGVDRLAAVGGSCAKVIGKYWAMLGKSSALAAYADSTAAAVKLIEKTRPDSRQEADVSPNVQDTGSPRRKKITPPPNFSDRRIFTET